MTIDPDIRQALGMFADKLKEVLDSGPPENLKVFNIKTWLSELDSELHSENDTKMSMLMVNIAKVYDPEEVLELKNLGLIIALFDLAWIAGKLYEQNSHTGH